MKAIAEVTKSILRNEYGTEYGEVYYIPQYSNSPEAGEYVNAIIRQVIGQNEYYRPRDIYEQVLFFYKEQGEPERGEGTTIEIEIDIPDDSLDIYRG